MHAKILVIEDEAEIREAIAAELSDSGYEPVQAVDGADGLQKIGAGQPDLILCDITMPKLDGLTMLKRFKADLPNLAQTPFVFLTAYSDRERQIEARKAGADEFLQKPVDFELLLEVVKNQLHKRRRSDEQQNEKLVKLFTKLQAELEETPKVPTDASAGRRPEPPAAPAQPAAASGPRKIESGTTLIGGQLAMVGLEAIKEELGDKWERLSAWILQIAENRISQNLTSDDTYRADGGNGFELCFGNASAAEVESTVAQIEEDIRNTIKAEQEAGKFEEIGVGAAAIAKTAEVQSAVFEVEVKDEELQSGVDLMTLVSGKIQQAANDLAQNASGMLSQIMRDAEVQPSPVLSHNMKRTNLVYLDLDATSRKTEKRLKHALCNDPNIMMQLDVARLGLAGAYIAQGSYSEQVYLLVPLSFATVFDKARSLSFFSVCRELPELALRSIIFVVEDAIGAVHPSLLADTVRSLKPISRQCFIRVRQPKPLPSQLGDGLIGTVVMSYYDLQSGLKRNNQSVRNFLGDLRKRKISLMIDMLQSSDQAANAKSTMANYLCFDRSDLFDENTVLI